MHCVPEIFGVDNHVYCYRHLKENFSSFYSKQSTRGTKGKENALQWLDKIAYVRVDIEYIVHMHKLCKFNYAFATWIDKMNLNIG